MDEGVRYYEVERDRAYPSVTSVISFITREKFAEWRAKVGEEAVQAGFQLSYQNKSCSECQHQDVRKTEKQTD